MILDQFGRQIDETLLKRPTGERISAATIRDQYSSYPSDGLTPRRLAAILKEADSGSMTRQAELFGEMESKDAHLASCLQTRKLAIQGLGWEIQPADESPAAKETADYCKSVIEKISDFDIAILNMLDAIGKGYSLLEILWDFSTGATRILELNWIHPKHVTFWDSYIPRLVVESNYRGVEIEPFRFVYHRYQARSGYDTSAGLLRICAWMYLFKNYAIKDWVAFAEVYGQPLRLGKYDPSATADDKQALLDAVVSIGSDAAGIISKNTEIEFVEAIRQSTQNIYQALADFCDAQISKAILGQTLTSDAGQGGSGSYALGKIHGEVRQDIKAADCRALSKTIVQQILRPIVIFQFGPEAPVPRHKFNFEPPEDYKLAADTYKILADMGFDLSQEHVSERFKIPKRKPGETPLARPAVVSPFGASARASATEGDGAPSIAAKATIKNDASEMLDELSRQSIERAPAAMEPLLGPIKKLLDESKSLEEFQDKLIVAAKDLDVSALGALMQKSLMLAHLSGRFSARR
jgi:phage gp29-like protein